MRVLKAVGGGLVALVALFLIVGLFLPSGWHVERTVTIAAGPDQIRPYLDAPSRWPEWSAWNETTYPDMKSEFVGPARGPGAAWVWRGESSGNGRLEVTRSDSGAVEYAMDFEGMPPFGGALRFEPAAGATTVRWTMSGDMGGNPIARYLAPFMDDMMVEELDKGLAKLKALVEAEPPPAPAPVVPAAPEGAKAEAEVPAAVE